METKKVLGIIFGTIAVLVFCFVLTWGIINFNKVKDGMSGTGLYTKEDLNKSYEDGYKTALIDKSEYEKLINSYRDTITTQTDQISQLNSQITTLTNNNKDYRVQISNLNTQVENLQTLVNQLNATNDSNTATISILNNQIKLLNNQIESMQSVMTDNDRTIINLNNRITELEKSIEYYESYISDLETESQVVATFEFDGSIYNIQVLNKGGYASVVNPTSTEYVIFNGWMVDDVIIDLSTYQINDNTKFVANATYKYSVKFEVDGLVVNSQIIEKDKFVTIPEEPTKEGYSFVGWSVDGSTIIDLTQYSIINDVKFIAVFKMQTATVTILDKQYGTTIGTKVVTVGEPIGYLDVEIPEKEGYEFKYWKSFYVSEIDLDTYIVRSDITIYPYYEQVQYIVKFIDNGTLLATQKYDVGANSRLINVPQPLGRDGLNFNGWVVSGYSETIDLSTYTINSDKTLVAHYSLPYAGYYEGIINGEKVVLEVETLTSSARTTNYGTTLPNIGNYNNVIVENGRVYINGISLNDAGLPYEVVEYNADNNTWIYSKLIYKNGEISSKTDYVLTFVKNEDTGRK